MYEIILSLIISIEAGIIFYLIGKILRASDLDKTIF